MYRPRDGESIPDAVSELLAELDEDPADETWPAVLPEQEALQEVAEQTAYGEVFLADLVSRQLTLSLALAGTFLATLFAIPLFNYFMPAVAALRVFGLTVSWLVLGVLLYPLIWVLAYYFVGTCKKYEDDFTRLVR